MNRLLENIRDWIVNRYIWGDKPVIPFVSILYLSNFPLFLKRLFLLTLPISIVLFCVLYILLCAFEVVFGLCCIFFIGIIDGSEDFIKWYKEHWNSYDGDHCLKD